MTRIVCRPYTCAAGIPRVSKLKKIMADTVASPLLQMVSERLDKLPGRPYHNEIVQKLKLSLAEIQALVVQAEERSEENEALKVWMTAVKNAAYEADDVFDKYDAWLMKRKVHTSFMFANSLVMGIKLRHKLMRVEARMDSLRRVEVGRTLGGNYRSSVIPNHTTDWRSPSSSFIVESEVVGRTLDKDKILSMVFEPNMDSPYTVIPIVGMGGLGKTTLAQVVYNNEKVTQTFELRVWICSPENLGFSGVMKVIMEHITMEPNDYVSFEILAASIKNKLQGKRFLIVLDDVWSEGQELWSSLRSLFGMGATGSKVIITTRNMWVVKLQNASVPYSLSPLTYEESWCLFRQIAFSGMQEKDSPTLEGIGLRIVEKCKGMPLAIKTLGGLLRFKRKVSEWVSIMEEDLWNLQEFESQILPALRLSYNHLPPHLKQCFAYCSIFPKDSHINKEKLILLWIAQGFVQSLKGYKSLEDTGHDYFMELFERSFFIDVSRDEFGEIVGCKLHDLVHDLALSIASVGCFIVDAGEASQDASKEIRHISVVGNSGSTVPEVILEAAKLRTLLLLSCKFESIPNIFLKFSCLRALGLSRSGISKLSGSIGDLKHLRYLDLSHNYIQALPESIANLKNLQTLELSQCHHLLKLPKAVCELTNLRTLNIESCPSLLSMPPGIGNLKLLQKLPLFVLGKKNDCGRLSELEELDLSGRLEIKNLDYVRHLTDAADAKLHEKKKIQSLALSWGHNVDVVSPEISPVDVLEFLRPYPHLKVLEIAGYEGSTFPTWIRQKDLPNLVKLFLSNCSSEELPPLGELPYLADLCIKGMHSVVHIGDEFYGNAHDMSFPSLRQLELSDMPNLLEWSNYRLEKASGSTKVESSSALLRGSFPLLDMLTVMGCRKLTALPSFPRLKSLALHNISETLLCSLSHQRTLSSLLIYEFQRPVLLPEGMVFDSIKTLTIFNCGSLISQLDEGINAFKFLQHLSIQYCDGLVSLPSGLRHLTSLLKLDIVECQNFSSITEVITDLSSLEELVVEGCPMLKSLPHGMCLPAHLKKLVVKRCPILQRSLEPGNGEEFFKIAHLPCVERDSGRFIVEEYPAEYVC